MSFIQYMLLGVLAVVAAFVFVFAPLFFIYGVTEALGGGFLAVLVALGLLYLIYWRWIDKK